MEPPLPQNPFPPGGGPRITRPAALRGAGREGAAFAPRAPRPRAPRPAAGPWPETFGAWAGVCTWENPDGSELNTRVTSRAFQWNRIKACLLFGKRVVAANDANDANGRSKESYAPVRVIRVIRGYDPVFHSKNSFAQTPSVTGRDIAELPGYKSKCFVNYWCAMYNSDSNESIHETHRRHHDDTEGSQFKRDRCRFAGMGSAAAGAPFICCRVRQHQAGKTHRRSHASGLDESPCLFLHRRERRGQRASPELGVRVSRSIGAPAAGLDSKHAEGWRCDYCRRNSREGRRQSWERQIGYQCR